MQASRSWRNYILLLSRDVAICDRSLRIVEVEVEPLGWFMDVQSGVGDFGTLKGELCIYYSI